MTTEKIKAAEARLTECQKVIAAQDVKRSEALDALANAKGDLRDAYLGRDLTLPKAQVKSQGRCGSEPQFYDVVIVKNTGKTITVRTAGRDCAGDQYRLAKDGRWWPYPQLDSWANGRELILDGSAS